MRIASTITVLLGGLAAVYGVVFAAFLVGGFSEGSRLAWYSWVATLLLGGAGAIAVWWWPKAAASLMGLAALGWLIFFSLAVVWAPARPNDVPGARLNMLALLVCLVPMTLLLLGTLFATRVKLGRSAAEGGA